MAETSRGRFTITLGQSGQVVKRTATIPKVDYSGSPPHAGSKRSIKDRLGCNFDASLLQGSQAHNKRQRGESYLDVNGVQDIHLGKDDLRLKLMQKNVFRRAQSDDQGKSMDLREKLSRTRQPPVRTRDSLDIWQLMPKPKETFTSSLDKRERTEPKDTIFRRIPPARSADDLPMVQSTRNSYSPWTLDHIRQRSPIGITGARRGLSPPKNLQAQEQRPLKSAFEDLRIPSYVNRDALDGPRSVSSSSAFMTKSVLPTAPSKPAVSLPVQLPTPGGISQRSLFMGEEQQNVEGFLQSLGLGKYAFLFKAEEVDMAALKQMDENDLRELGVPMGPRKKILFALPRSKRQLCELHL